MSGEFQDEYTRNTGGRKLLLRARSEAFSAEFRSRADRISVWE